MGTVRLWHVSVGGIPALMLGPLAVEASSRKFGAGQDAQGYLLLGNVYRKLNDTANAKQNFKLGVERLAPPIPASLSWAYNSYGIMLYNEGDYDDAYVNLMQASPAQSSGSRFAAKPRVATCLHLGRTDELNNARSRLEQLNSKYLPDLNQEIQRQQEVAKKTKPAR